MNDHNLDDLIIDTDTHKQSKAKGFLTIIALLIVVLIVAIILTKIILKTPEVQNPELADTNSEVISPELTLKPDTPSEASEEEDDLSKMIKSELDSSDSSSDTQQETVKEETVTVNASQTQTTVPSENKTETKTASTASTQPKTSEVVAIPTREPAPVEHKTTAAPKAHKPKITQPASRLPSAYYVQVGSFSKTPSADSRLIHAIRSSGYHYVVFNAPNGMKKVLIGPYKNRAAADKAIVPIKSRINKSAFVFTK